MTTVTAPNPYLEPNSTAHFEYRVIGPPGCGKTTYLSSEITRVSDLQLTPLIISLTRSAAQEIIERDLPLTSPEQAGTLHSLCYRMHGHPDIAENHIEDWNEHHTREDYQITRFNRSQEDEATDFNPQRPGDYLLTEYKKARAQMIPLEKLSRPIQNFANAWNAWKAHNKLLDYTDFIEKAYAENMEPPFHPDVIYVDEAQDMDHLSMSLIRKWGEAAGSLVVVGDPDQNIYRWRGAEPEAFTKPDLPPENYILLDQTYRLPRAIHKIATEWIDQSQERTPVKYHPTNQEGEVRTLNNNYHQTNELILDMQDYLHRDKQIMILTSCTYMLQPIIEALRTHGMAFHNPMARSNGAWNPLQKRPNQTTAADRILAYLSLSNEGLWTADHLRQWTSIIKVEGTLKRSAKTLIKELENDDEDRVAWETLYSLFTDEAIDAAMNADLDWYENHIMPSKKATSAFPLHIARTQGAHVLGQRPQIVVGHIHSVKGAETDVVYLFPDLSKAAMDEWMGEPWEQNAVYRLFYVAMTRAKETLVICKATSKWEVELPV